MTPQQMQDKIKNLEVRVALLEKEIGRLTGKAVPADVIVDPQVAAAAPWTPGTSDACGWKGNRT